MVDDEPMVFRPKPGGLVDFVWGIGCLSIGISAIVLGMVVGVAGEGAMFPCCAVITLPPGVLLVFSYLRPSERCMTLDRKGVRRSPVLFAGFAFGGFAFKWKDVHGWWVGSVGRPNIHQVDPEENERKILRLEVHGRFFPVAVDQSDVADPGFDAFVAAVRRFAPDQELTLPTNPYFKGGDR
jgi:hypothetical protein